MSEVYLAHDMKLNQPVALKFLPRIIENEPNAIRNLIEELAVARRIAHPNVCRVYDIGEIESRHFISMEYIDGLTLQSLLQRIGPFPQDRAIGLALELCHGLSAAHEEGILHRDLKPSNLMLDELGRLKITDLGLAITAERLIGEEAMHGTVAYMAPEQLDPALDRAEMTVKSDIYALGLVLYEMFTGQKAFEPAFPTEMMQRKWEMDFRHPGQLVANLDSKVERAILRCLQGNPAHRPASAQQVARELSEVLRFLLVSALVDRTELAERLGNAAADFFRRHDELVQHLIYQYKGSRVDGSDEFLLMFEGPSNAISYALAYHDALDHLSHEGIGLAAQVGIHVGIVTLRAGSPPEAAADTRDKVTIMLDLARPRQTLMTAAVFNEARSAEEKIDHAKDVRWLAHGTYTFAESGELIDIFEVGREGFAPLQAPANSKAAKPVSAGSTIPGWRPATGLSIPQRQSWRLVEKLGEGGFGEIWLAIHQKTNDRRVFKFCYELDKLDALKREISLFRFLRWELGDRDDIASIVDWNFDEQPYFIESEYTAAGNLVEWAEQRGGIHLVPLEERLEIVAQAATALSAAHSAGVIHKDVKPANLLIRTGRDGQVQVQLADFGIGMLIERERLATAGVTDTGLDTTSPAGTRLYMAPEVLEGKALTMQADIYSLGILLYQMVVGDLSRALAPGFERDVQDELLREDILAMVDAAPERRLSDARELARRLRTIESRRAEQTRMRKTRATQARLRRWLAASLTVLLILTTFAGNWWLQSRRTAREARTFQLVSAFLVDMFRVLPPDESLGEKITARQVLEWGVKRAEVELAEEPQIQATLFHSIGLAYRDLGLYSESSQLLEQALTIRQDLHGADHVDVAESLNSLAGVVLASGEYERAEALARQALVTRRRLLGENHPAMAESLDTLGHILYAKANFDEAEPLFREALAIHRQELEEHEDVATSLDNLGMLLSAKGDLEAAERLYREALAIRRRVLSERHPDVAISLNNLGLLRAQPVARARISRDNGGNKAVKMALTHICANWSEHVPLEIEIAP
ncbi:MAG: protein kinase [bacterium]|nr:protein kinase [bacterium]